MIHCIDGIFCPRWVSCGHDACGSFFMCVCCSFFLQLELESYTIIFIRKWAYMGLFCVCQITAQLTPCVYEQLQCSKKYLSIYCLKIHSAKLLYATALNNTIRSCKLRSTSYHKSPTARDRGMLMGSVETTPLQMLPQTVPLVIFSFSSHKQHLIRFVFFFVKPNVQLIKYTQCMYGCAFFCLFNEKTLAGYVTQ